MTTAIAFVETAITAIPSYYDTLDIEFEAPDADPNGVAVLILNRRSTHGGTIHINGNAVSNGVLTNTSDAFHAQSSPVGRGFVRPGRNTLALKGNIPFSPPVNGYVDNIVLMYETA